MTQYQVLPVPEPLSSLMGIDASASEVLVNMSAISVKASIDGEDEGEII